MTANESHRSLVCKTEAGLTEEEYGVFDEIGDMPLHPLVTHAPVIGIPLALLLALLFTFPRTRNWARWPLALTVLGSTAAVFVSRESGETLERWMALHPCH